MTLQMQQAVHLWLIYMYDMPQWAVEWWGSWFCKSHMWHDSFIHVPWRIHICDTTHSYISHDSSIYLTCRSGPLSGGVRGSASPTCDMTHLYLWHDPSTYLTRLIYISHCRSGPLSGGVVGLQLPRFSIFGAPVVRAARMAMTANSSRCSYVNESMHKCYVICVILICMCVYLYKYIHITQYVCTRMYTYIYVTRRVCIHDPHMYVYVCMYIYTCTYLNTYVYVCIYIHNSARIATTANSSRYTCCCVSVWCSVV